MNRQDFKILHKYLTPDEPFGPIDATEIKEPRAIELLFERHNEIYKNLHQRASIIIGRRGAGKTSYLNTAHFANGYKYVAKVNTAEAFTNVISVISKFDFRTIPVFAESVAKVWDNTLHVGLFADIRTKLPNGSKARKYINDYLAKIGVREGNTIDDALWQIAEIIAQTSKTNTSGLMAKILQSLDTVNFDKTKAILVGELEKSGYRAAVLLDNLDDFQLQMDVSGQALQGLLKFLGESNSPASSIDMRFCLPAEIYNHFKTISINPNKDFRRKLLLQWVASELVFLAAHRLCLFCSIQRPDELIASNTTISDKKQARVIVESLFPESCTSKLNVKEDPLAYIMRHTQLIPRHLLIILNSIASHNRCIAGKSSLHFSEEAIRKGISAVEETIVQEIFVAYRHVYPFAREVCERCIPELFMIFSYGDLERVFRTHGKRAMQTNDFFAFKRMLIEIGAVGHVLTITDRYIQAEFEYAVPRELSTGTDDLLCFHPLFAQVFSVKIRENKPVYPYGSQIEDKDCFVAS